MSRRPSTSLPAQRAAFGRAAFGRAAFGRAVFGRAAFGCAAFGCAAFGRAVSAQLATLSAAGLLLTLACGTQAHGDIPPALLEAIAAGSGSEQVAYPGPYGNQIGDIATNVCFEVWDNPLAADYAPDALKPQCLEDYYDPTGERHRLLLINTAAVWCLACRTEYGGSGQRPSVAEEAAAREEDGFAILGLMFQDQDRNPATVENAVAWAQTYEIEFPFGLDKNFEMDEFASSSVQPFNMLVDTQTMEIVGQFEGDQPTTLWPAVDAFLAQSKEE